MSVNKVILLGHVGKDPEYKEFENGGCVAQFTLATSKREVVTQNGTKLPERTEWHNIVMHGKFAKVCEKFVKKGDKLYIEGELRTRSWESNGMKCYITEVIGYTMEMLTAKPSNNPAPPIDDCPY